VGGGDVSWFGTHAGAEGETLATALRRRSEWRRRPVTAAVSAGDVRRRCRRRPVPVAATTWVSADCGGAEARVSESGKKSGSDYHVRGEE
jgi:hypothetical protein